MRYKVKVLVGFYQCLSAVPSVFNVVPPVGLEEYTLDSPLRMLHVKNMGKDLTLEELRICP